MKRMYAFMNTAAGTELYKFMRIEQVYDRAKCGSGYVEGRRVEDISNEEAAGWWLLIAAHDEKGALALIHDGVYMRAVISLADQYHRGEIELGEYIKKVRVL